MCAKQSSRARRNPGGRPLEIDDEALFQRRDGFIELFTMAWGDIGWELRRARTAEQLVAVFSAVTPLSTLTYLVAPFARGTSRFGTARDVRENKRTLNEAREKAVELEGDLRPLADRVRQARNALAQMSKTNVSKENAEIIRVAHNEWLEPYAVVRARAEDLDEEIVKRECAQRDLEASFAQRELLSFLRARKYAYNPRNVACAVAGLPYIGWQQSFRRCGRQRSSYWPSRRFRIFQLIEASSNGSKGAFLNVLSSRILALPTRDPYQSDFRRRLCDDWRYLRLAVEETCAVDELSPKRRAYYAYAAYLRNISRPRSTEEQVLASIQQLDPDRALSY